MNTPHSACLIVDSITEAVGRGEGAVVVSGSHGGLSAARFAALAKARVAVFNDAGVGSNRAGIAGLALLDAEGIAACTVSHDSARIGDATSTLEDGVISHVNLAAAALGATAGLRLRDWLFGPRGICPSEPRPPPPGCAGSRPS